MTIRPGALRFNTDSMKLEIFRGSANYNGSASMAGIGTLAAGQWEEIQATSPEVQTGGTRGLWMGGGPGNDNTIDYVTISTTGNAINFGDLVGTDHRQGGSLASRTRGVHGGGWPGSTAINTIDFVTIASTGDAIDFGDRTIAARAASGGGNDTRGLFVGGLTPTATNTIDYITIASTGDAVNFGDANSTASNFGVCANSVRLVFGGNQTNGDIEYVTISTLGNSATNGVLLDGRTELPTAASNSTRGIFFGGEKQPSGSIINRIQYLEIASLGNTIDFGDLTTATRQGGACASPTRAVYGGGLAPGSTDTIEYVQIMSTGNAVDFGNLTTSRSTYQGCSNGHGGL
jgi:hypothetical protein